MDPAKHIHRVAVEKNKFRKKIAALPTPEKVRRMVELQKIVAATRKERGEHVRVWKID
jgi:hypothetical protein